MSDPSSGCRELVSYQYFMLYYYFLDFILLLCLCVKSCFPIFLLQQQQNLPNLFYCQTFGPPNAFIFGTNPLP